MTPRSDRDSAHELTVTARTNYPVGRCATHNEAGVPLKGTPTPRLIPGRPTQGGVVTSVRAAALLLSVTATTGRRAAPGVASIRAAVAVRVARVVTRTGRTSPALRLRPVCTGSLV